MIVYTSVVFVWTAICCTWLIYSTVTEYEEWGNFTTWVLFMQTIFFGLHIKNSLIHNSTSPLPNSLQHFNKFCDCYFLPVLFACEITTGASVVYMMIDRADLLNLNILRYGDINTWVGNFFVHYFTLLMLLCYMTISPLKYIAINNAIIEPSQLYYHIIGFATFVILFSYIAIFVPSEHYGVHNATQLQANLGMLGAGFFALLAFQLWRQDNEW
jgi:hypothetical protein